MLLRRSKFESLTFGAYFTVIKGMKELLGDSGHLAIKTRTINTGTLSLGLFYDTYSNSVPESTAVKTDSVAEAKHTQKMSFGVSEEHSQAPGRVLWGVWELSH